MVGNHVFAGRGDGRQAHPAPTGVHLAGSGGRRLVEQPQQPAGVPGEGAQWEGDELVTYDLEALRRNYAASDEEWLPDSD